MVRLKLERIKREKEQIQNMVKTNVQLKSNRTVQCPKKLTWILKECVIEIFLLNKQD